MGFEYGYSRDYPEALVLWEAQFGDFANVAQAVIDQFVCAGEDKWNLLSGFVLLLPHGYEGQGPEHSSARVERFLQLAARDNIQICQPSNAGQYFHLLRRQALRKWSKPLIVFTPKSMLRHPDALSPLEDLTHQKFLPVIPDTEAQDAKRILLCTGKIGHELRTERQKRNDFNTAIVFLEQMYPFPEEELTRRTGTSQRGPRHRLGAGRTLQHGRTLLHAAAPEAHPERPARALGEAFRKRQPSHRLGQGARGGAEDAAGAGIHQTGLKATGLQRLERSAQTSSRLAQ